METWNLKIDGLGLGSMFFVATKGPFLGAKCWFVSVVFLFFGWNCFLNLTWFEPGF